MHLSTKRRSSYRTLGKKNQSGSGVGGASRVTTKRSKKKLEGYDNGRSRVDTYRSKKRPNSRHTRNNRASRINKNFTSNVQNLKKSSVKQVEDEYIKALQEEVKILEYQLKILKDKEMEQQAAVSQIDKFFSDGVPLNDNILALKTQYQDRKKNGMKMLDDMSKTRMMKEKVTLDLNAGISKLKDDNKALEALYEKRETDYKEFIDK